MNIRKRRESLGLSQEELGRLAGVSYATISRLERGLRVPQKSTLAAIENALERVEEQAWVASAMKEVE